MNFSTATQAELQFAGFRKWTIDDPRFRHIPRNAAQLKGLGYSDELISWILRDTPGSGPQIMLIPENKLKRIEPGTVLYSIMGEEVVVGKDEIDTDARGGMLAYGLPILASDNSFRFTIDGTDMECDDDTSIYQGTVVARLENRTLNSVSVSQEDYIDMADDITRRLVVEAIRLLLAERGINDVIPDEHLNYTYNEPVDWPIAVGETEEVVFEADLDKLRQAFKHIDQDINIEDMIRLKSNS